MRLMYDALHDKNSCCREFLSVSLTPTGAYVDVELFTIDLLEFVLGAEDVFSIHVWLPMKQKILFFFFYQRFHSGQI